MMCSFIHYFHFIVKVSKFMAFGDHLSIFDKVFVFFKSFLLDLSLKFRFSFFLS